MKGTTKKGDGWIMDIGEQKVCFEFRNQETL